MPEIEFRLKRQDPRDKKNPDSHWEEYTVSYEGENLTVLEGLFYIQENLDPSLSFRYCCRASVWQLRHVYQRSVSAGLPDEREAPRKGQGHRRSDASPAGGQRHGREYG